MKRTLVLGIRLVGIAALLMAIFTLGSPGRETARDGPQNEAAAGRARKWNPRSPAY